MKENKYDDEEFFKKYCQFPRSIQGLDAAGEWHEMRKLLPDFAGKRVLDIGCGFGWYCIYAAEHGASFVLGTDISEKMLAVAKDKTILSNLSNIKYHRIAMEDMDFPPNEFDVIISSLAFHYTADFKDICKRISRCLTAGGNFVFSVEHPIFTANETQDWVYDSGGTRNHWPVDNYFREGTRDTIFLGERVTKYHRTLTTYLNILLNAGFSITEIIEPKPSSHLLDTIPQMKDELRRPMMLLVSAQKIG